MTQELDLLLVNPGARKQVYGKLGSSLSGIEPPLWCGLIAAFIREHGYSAKIIDAEAENWDPEHTAEKIVEYNPLLVGIIVLGSNPSASSTPKMTATSELLTALKKKAPDIKTLLSGLHPSALPERTLTEESVDFVCQGEGFYTILELLDLLKAGEELEDYKIKGLWYIKDNEVISNGWGKLAQNLDELPFVAWDLLPMEKYRAHNWHCFDHIDQRKPYAVIYTSLGCPFNCTYCNIRTMYNGQPGIRFRSPKKAVEEIGFLVRNYKIKNLKIIDELFTLREDHVIRICDLIIQRGYNLNIWAYARIDTVNEKLLVKMKQAGINWLAYGIESGSKKVRDGVNKGRFGQDKIKKAVEMTKAAGIYIIGNFIFGLPDDDLETMQETLNMAKEFNFEYVNFYTTMAYPGSQLYEDALKKGIKLPETWHGYGQYSEETLPLPTKYLSAAEVLRFRDNAFKEYYKNPKYIRMIKEKFGPKVVEHIKQMLKNEIRRKFV
ncbi:cobalamin-dependent protein [bacterium]|nr:cobalamin-dependent protein [bacterium]